MTPHITNRDIDQAFDEGEIYCLYQPLIDLETGHVRGAEALVRWEHPEYGELLPRVFLPHVARQGRCHEITSRVIGLSLKAARDCIDLYPSFLMHINLGAEDFCDAALDAAFSTHLRRHAISPLQVRLDLSEHDFSQLTRKGRARLQGLLGRGFSLALEGPAHNPAREDDNLPVSEWQIKGGDLLGLANALSPSKSGRLNGLLRMAERINRETSAIGLGAIQDLEAARALGIRKASGHAIAAPMPRADLRSWVKDRRPAASSTSTQQKRRSA